MWVPIFAKSDPDIITTIIIIIITGIIYLFLILTAESLYSYLFLKLKF